MQTNNRITNKKSREIREPNEIGMESFHSPKDYAFNLPATCKSIIQPSKHAANSETDNNIQKDNEVILQQLGDNY